MRASPSMKGTSTAQLAAALVLRGSGGGWSKGMPGNEAARLLAPRCRRKRAPWRRNKVAVVAAWEVWWRPNWQYIYGTIPVQTRQGSQGIKAMTRIPDFSTVDVAGAAVVTPAVRSEPWHTPEGIAVKGAYGPEDLTGLDFLDTYPGLPP